MIDILAFLLGLLIIGATLLSAMRTFVLPRADTDRLTTLVFSVNRALFNLVLRFAPTYREKDRILALYAPISLVLLPPIWLSLIALGYTLLFWASGVRHWAEAFTIAGSSILTLGFAKGTTLLHTVLSFTAAVFGLVMAALLIAYLPTMYNAFAKREVAVDQLAVRAGTPPSPINMLLRYHRLERLGQLDAFWDEWETWFTEVEESHTSLSALVFFRSPTPEQSWVNAAGAVMDAAALRISLIQLPTDPAYKPLPGGIRIPNDPTAAIAIRAGFMALRRIAEAFDIPHNPDPQHPLDPISISREDFDQVVELFRAWQIPLKPDLDQAWQDFAGWRVNYDSILLDLQKLTVAPPAPWFKPTTTLPEETPQNQ